MTKDTNWAPMQRVIVFRAETDPYIAYVTMPIHYSSVQHVDGKTRVNTSRKKEDAEEGKGLMVWESRLQPYSDELWEACQEWIARAAQSNTDLARLRKGKAPMHSRRC